MNTAKLKFRPETVPTDWLFSFSIFVVSLIVYIVTMREAINPYDEGLILVGSTRVLDGQLPYRDFWTMYGPGQFYVIAGLMMLFGKSVLAERVYACAVRAGITALAGIMLSRMSKKSVCIVPLTAIIVLLASDGQYLFPIYPAILFSLSAMSFIQKSFDARERRVLPFAAGLCLGVAALFRHDLALYALLACLAGCILFALLRRASSGVLRSFLSSSFLMCAGCAVVVMPVAFVLVRHVPVADLFQNLIDIPARVYPKMRWLPFPNLASLHAESFALVV